MKRGDRVQCQVVTQGGPRVNDGCVVEIGLDVAAVVIGLGSKHCELEGYSDDDDDDGCEPELVIGDNGGKALHLAPLAAGPTLVRLPDFRGWKFWCGQVSRYSILVCLIRSRK